MATKTPKEIKRPRGRPKKTEPPRYGKLYYPPDESAPFGRRKDGDPALPRGTGRKLAELAIANGDVSYGAECVQMIAATNGIAQSVNPYDPESLRQAYYNYLQYCAENGLIPGNAQAYRAMGISAGVVAAIEQGRTRNNDPRFKELINQIKADMSAVREKLANDNKINVAWAIFCAKNYDGMRDNPLDTTPQTDPMGEKKDAQAIAEKYKDIT